MIRIACTNCKTILSIDDAFAGGVCRCQHCGTIQTVPVAAKETVGAQVSGQSMGGSKVVYRGEGRSEAGSPGTGLDELAGAVASSGLTGSGLASRRLTRQGGEAPKRNMVPVFIAVGAVIAVLVGIIVFLAMRGGSTNTNSGTARTDPSLPQVTPAVVPVVGAANFCGIKLDGNVVIYLLDRGSGTKEIFPALKDAALKSATSLGADRRFEIVFWNNGSDAAFPDNRTTYANKEMIAAAQRALDDISAFGASDVSTAMTRALIGSPDTLVIATAKGFDLDDAWVSDVLKIRGTSPVKIHTVNLGSGGPSPALKSLAAKTGGEYREVNDNDLRAYAGD